MSEYVTDEAVEKAARATMSEFTERQAAAWPGAVAEREADS